MLLYVVKYMNGYYILSEKMGKVIYYGLFKYRMFIEIFWFYGFCFNYYIGDIEIDYVFCYVC